jgi:hypothetical protein
MSVEMLSAADAANRIRAYTRAGLRVLGVDGFQIVPNGRVGRLDLILDLSLQQMTAEAAEAAALEFVAAHKAEDVMFEVVVPTPLLGG